jgi:pimeloyl-ACP methyl ester carboxylesterase
MVEPLMSALAKYGLRVFAPDLPGFGESAKPARPLDLAEMADEPALWLRASGIPRAIFMGASLGCHVITELAVRHPALVDRLVLQGPASNRLLAACQRRCGGRWSTASASRGGYISRIDYAKADLRRVLATIRLALHESIEDKLPWCECPRWCCGVIVM